MTGIQATLRKCDNCGYETLIIERGRERAKRDCKHCGGNLEAYADTEVKK